MSQREEEPIALAFLPYGFHVVTLRYNVAPHRFPTQLRQVAAAMEVIHANAEQWKVDTDRIAIMGFSAGAHLAGHYANCCHIPQVRQVFPDSKPVRAQVLCYPVITADPVHGHRGSVLNLTGAEEITPELLESFSLERLVTDRTPPAFLWHTRPDGVVPVMNSLLYAQALAEHGVDFSLYIYPRGRHGLSTVDAQTNDSLEPAVQLAHEWIDAAAKWLKLTL